jgi:hypothetical protein
LPEGWSITQTRDGVAPPDWFTDNPKAGFLIEGGAGEGEAFRICFLPRDWIGIRKPVSHEPKSLYCQGILIDDQYKAITASTEVWFLERVLGLGKGNWSSPSLAGSGCSQALHIFDGKLKAVDQTALALIAKHCVETEDRAEAAASLVRLGVPAKAVFLRAAREPEEFDQELFCTVLGFIGGDDAITALCEILADSRMSDEKRGAAALMLWRCSDKRIGPALHLAVKQLRREDAISRVARSPALLRYQPAAPDLLAAFKRMRDDYYKLDVAHALAALRCKEAIPEIRGFLGELIKKGDDFLAPEYSKNAELVLLRLTGAWGTPSEEIRTLIVPPKEFTLGRKIEFTILVENIGAAALKSWSDPDGILLDGKPPAEFKKMPGAGVASKIYPGEIFQISCDLSPYLKKSGVHTVQYVRGKAGSKVVTITVHDWLPSSSGWSPPRTCCRPR